MVSLSPLHILPSPPSLTLDACCNCDVPLLLVFGALLPHLFSVLVVIDLPFCFCRCGPMKALVWFWIIDETLVLTPILSVCRLNEVGTCQVMEQEMIMVMTTR